MSDSKRLEKSTEEVAAQREVKKSEDSIRKLESKMGKLAEGTAERSTIQSEIDALKARVAELCAEFGIESKSDKKTAGKSAAPATSAPAAPVPSAAITAPATPEPAAAESEPKRLEKSAEEVAAQREVKKSEDSIRKLESKMGKLAEGTAERSTIQSEIDALKARVTELCAEFGIESKSDKKTAGKSAAPTAPSAVPSRPNTIPAIAIGTTPTAPGARVDALKLREELELCKSRLAIATDPREMDELKVRLHTLLDACISMASEQVSLATARASPAVVPQQHGQGSMTPFQSAAHTSSAVVPSMDLPSASAAVGSSATATNSGSKAAAGNTKVGGPSAALASTTTSVDRIYGAESTASDAVSDAIHPRFVDLAIRTRMLQVVGGNARTLALLDAIIAFAKTTRALAEGTIKELGAREKNEFIRLLNINLEVVRRARPFCQGMQYVVETIALRVNIGEFIEQENLFVRDQIVKLCSEVGDGLLDTINKVSSRTQEVTDNDTILVYGRSSSVEQLLLNVAAERKLAMKNSSTVGANAAISASGASGGSAPQQRLRVIVLDSAPLFEGRGLARRLQAAGVAVRYALASAACQLMPLCTKVFLGASVVMQSGDVVSRCGTAMVAACAKTCRRPVFVFAEDHKLTREVWMGSLTRNELVANAFPPLAVATGHQQRLFGQSATSNNCSAQQPPSGHLYDVTPCAFIDAMVTRIGRVQPNAVCSLLLPEADEEGHHNNGDDDDEEEEDDSDATGSENGSERGATSSIGFKSPQLMQ